MKLLRPLAYAIQIALGSSVLSTAMAEGISDALSFSLEEITVTATRRATPLSDTGISISALGEDTLKEMGAINFKDFTRTLPGVNFTEGKAPGEQTIIIRGVNFPSNRFQQSTVGVYIDELSLTQNGRNPDIDLMDVERVEVLRGPQGTLYGSSSMGGTIRYISKKPSADELTGYIEAGVEDTENGDLGYSVNGVANIPLIEDKLAMRVSGYYRDLDGWIDSVGWAGSSSGDSNAIIDASSAENKINGEETVGGRLSLRWHVSELLTADFMYLHHDTEVSGLSNENPYWGEGQQQRRFEESYSDEMDSYAITLNYEMESGILMWTSSYIERDYRRTSDPSRQRIGLAWWFGDFSDAFDYGIDAFTDPSGDFIGHAAMDRPIEWELQTHELRFTSDGEGRLHSVVGAYYSKADNRWQQTETYPGISASPGTLVPFAYPDFFLGTSYTDAATTTDFIVEASGYSGQDTNTDGSVDIFQYEPALYANLPSDVGFFSDRKESIEQLSFYGNFTYDLTDDWDITLGARWFDVEIDNEITLGGPIAGTDALLAADELLETPAGPARNALVQSILDDAATNYISTSNPKQGEEGTQILLGTSYDLNAEAMIYFTFAEGFRVGGVNRAIPRRDGSVIPESFDSDSLESYELGWKTQWLDNRLQLNGAAFYIDWEDIQISQTDEVTQFDYVENAGEAEIKGLELELRWLATEGLEFNLGATHLDHQITEGEDEGSELPLVSNESYFVSSRYEFNLTDSMDAYVRADWTYTGGHQTDPDPTRPRIDSYETVNLRAGVISEGWEVAFYIKNALGDDSIVDAVRAGNSASQGRVTRIKPRTLGASVTWRF